MPDRLTILQTISTYIEQGWQHIKRSRFFIIIGICVGLGLLLLQQLIWLGQQLDSLGNVGADRADVWGLVVTIVGLLLSLATVLVPIWLHKKEQQAYTGGPPKKQTKSLSQPGLTWRRVVVVIVFASLTFFIPATVSRLAFLHWEREDITHQIQLSDNATMKHGSTAQALLPATQHQQLKIKFKLESATSTGSCVAPALMTITPTHNGNNSRAVSSIRSDTWQTIELGNLRDKTALTIALDLAEEPSCAVKLNVGSAFYYH